MPEVGTTIAKNEQKRRFVRLRSTLVRNTEKRVERRSVFEYFMPIFWVRTTEMTLTVHFVPPKSVHFAGEFGSFRTPSSKGGKK